MKKHPPFGHEREKRVPLQHRHQLQQYWTLLLVERLRQGSPGGYEPAPSQLYRYGGRGSVPSNRPHPPSCRENALGDRRYRWAPKDHCLRTLYRRHWLPWHWRQRQISLSQHLMPMACKARWLGKLVAESAVDDNVWLMLNRRTPIQSVS